MLGSIRNDNNFNFLKTAINLYGYSDRITMVFIQNWTFNNCSRKLNKLDQHRNAKKRKKSWFCNMLNCEMWKIKHFDYFPTPPPQQYVRPVQWYFSSFALLRAGFLISENVLWSLKTDCYKLHRALSLLFSLFI